MEPTLTLKYVRVSELVGERRESLYQILLLCRLIINLVSDSSKAKKRDYNRVFTQYNFSIDGKTYEITFHSLNERKTFDAYVCYAAPEVLRGQQKPREERVPLDHRSDIYTLGIVMWEIFTGRVPFFSQKKEEVVEMQYSETPRSLSKSKTRALPKALDRILWKCLAKEKEKRYQTFFGLGKDVDKLIKMCEECWEDVKDVDFPPGEYDFPHVEGFLEKSFQLSNKSRKQLQSNFQGFFELTGVHLIFLVGECGFSKSALVENMLREKRVGINHQLALGRFGESQQCGIVSAVRNLLGRITFSSSTMRFKKTCDNFLTEPILETLFGLFPCLASILSQERKVEQNSLSGIRFPGKFEYKYVVAFAKLMEAISNYTRIVLVLNDCHLMDDFSQILLKALIRCELKSFLIVFTHNELNDNHPVKDVFERIVSNKSVQTVEIIDLEPIDFDGIYQEQLSSLSMNHKKVLKVSEMCEKRIYVDRISKFLEMSMNDTQRCLNFLEVIEFLKRDGDKYSIAHKEISQILSKLEYQNSAEENFKMGFIILDEYEKHVDGSRSREEVCEDILRHLNRCENLITEKETRRKLCLFNFDIAKKREYRNSRVEKRNEHLKMAVQFLKPGVWDPQNREISFSIHLEMAKALFHQGDIKASEETLSFLDQHANESESVDLVVTSVIVYTSTNDIEKAFKKGFGCLKRLGASDNIRRDSSKSKEEVKLLFEEVKRRGVERILKEKVMEDERQKDVMKLLRSMIPLGFYKDMRKSIKCEMMRKTLEHGFDSESVAALVFFSGILCEELGEVQFAGVLCKEAIRFAEIRGLSSSLPYVYEYSCYSVFIYSEDVWSFLELHCQKTMECCLEKGKLRWAGFSRSTLAGMSLLFGEFLPTVVELAKDGIEFGNKTKNTFVIGSCNIYYHIATKLGGVFNDGVLENGWEKKLDLLCLPFLKVCTMWELVFYGEYEKAYIILKEIGENNFHGFIATIKKYLETLLLIFFSKDDGVVSQKMSAFERLFRSSPSYQAKILILRAEKLRRESKSEVCYPAIELYEEAIRIGKKYSIISDSAFAAERIGQMLYESSGSKERLKELSTVYLKKAILFYDKWGCQSKVEHIKTKHRDVLEKKNASQINYVELNKIFREISQQLEIDYVLERTLVSMTRYSGATKGILIKRSRGQSEVFAETWIEKNKDRSYSKNRVNYLQKKKTPLETTDIPVGMWNLMLNFRDSQFVENVEESIFAQNEYFNHVKTTSMMGLSISFNDNCLGGVFLSLDTMEKSFTNENFDFLKILASQIGPLVHQILTIEDQQESRLRFLWVFEESPVAMREVDMSHAIDYLEMKNFFSSSEPEILLKSPNFTQEFSRKLKTIAMNKKYQRVFKLSEKFPVSEKVITPLKYLEGFILSLYHKEYIFEKIVEIDGRMMVMCWDYNPNVRVVQISLSPSVEDVKKVSLEEKESHVDLNLNQMKNQLHNLVDEVAAHKNVYLKEFKKFLDRCSAMARFLMSDAIYPKVFCLKEFVISISEKLRKSFGSSSSQFISRSTVVPEERYICVHSDKEALLDCVMDMCDKKGGKRTIEVTLSIIGETQDSYNIEIAIKDVFPLKEESKYVSCLGGKVDWINEKSAVIKIESIIKSNEKPKKESMRILMVDDSVIQMTMFKYMVKRTPHVVTTRKEGNKAFELVKEGKNKFDIIFLDLNMQRDQFNGYEICAILREKFKYEGPIVATSASVDNRRQREVGFTSFMPKPISREKFLNFLQKYQ